MIRSVLFFSTLAFTSIPLIAASEAPSVTQNSQILFRSDQVLLDAQRRQKLANYFCEFAKKNAGGSAVQLRNAYKALLLAQALGKDPKNLADGEALIQFNNNGKALAPMQREPVWVRNMLQYLSTIRLKQDNLILVELASEVINDSKNIEANPVQSQYWLGSIPSLDHFIKPAVTKPRVARRIERKPARKRVIPVDTNEVPQQVSPLTKIAEPIPQVTWKQRSLNIPLIQGFYSGSNALSEALIKITEPSADPLGEVLKYSIVAQQPDLVDAVNDLNAVPKVNSPRSMNQALAFSELWQQKAQLALSTKWPNQQPAKITLEIPYGYNYSYYGKSLISSALSKLSSSLNQELETAGYIIIAEINAADALSTSTQIWNIINDLESCEQKYLIFVPKSTEEIFLLARKIGYIDIFLNHEIIAIESLEGAEKYLIDRQSESLRLADIQFREIKEVLNMKPTATMLKNHFVQQKISETCRLNPQLISAKSLILNEFDTISTVDSSTMIEYWKQILEPTAVWLDYTPLSDPSKSNFDTRMETNIEPQQLIEALKLATNIAPINTQNRYRGLYRAIDKLISELTLYSKSYLNDQLFTSKLGKSKAEGKKPIRKLFNELQMMLLNENGI